MSQLVGVYQKWTPKISVGLFPASRVSLILPTPIQQVHTLSSYIRYVPLGSCHGTHEYHSSLFNMPKNENETIPKVLRALNGTYPERRFVIFFTRKFSEGSNDFLFTNAREKTFFFLQRTGSLARFTLESHFSLVHAPLNSTLLVYFGVLGIRFFFFLLATRSRACLFSHA